MELSLDSSSSVVFVPKTISDFLSQISAIGDVSQRSAELVSFVKRLEEELRKIEVFKRELPLCMLLVKDAIENLNGEVMQGKAMEDRPVIEEFLPLKGNSEEGGGVVSGKENGDKKNWMSSAQLWSSTTLNTSELKLQMNVEGDRSVAEDPNQGMGAAFPSLKDDKEISEVPSLSLMTPLMSEAMMEGNSVNIKNSKSSSNSCRAGLPVKLQNTPQQQQQQQASLRKQRRCWSPELHRRFVDALQRLGGTQATPKQIRELMQVDGLTNDEVKSHLQKYRLHVRKVTPSCGGEGNNGLWMSLDGDQSKANNVQSGSPQGPLLAVGFGKGRSTTGGESGDSREAEEDEKSDGQSWKCGAQNNQGRNV